MGDLTPDGKPDIAVANTVQLAVLTNTTTGPISFAPSVPFNSGNVPQAVFIGDLNEDGKSDVAVVNETSGTLSIFTNTSTPFALSFAPQIDFTTASRPYSVVMGDLDADGRPDVVVTSFDNNVVSIYKNTTVNGVVSFAPRADIGTGAEPRSVALGDLNGDGKPDMVVVNAVSSTISVYQNKSSGGTISFQARIDFPTGSFPQHAALADFDNDGKLDIAVVGYQAAAVYIHRNTVNELAIHSFTPTSGTAGTAVTITGNNFTGATAVRFGGVNAASYTVNSPTSITAVLGSGATGDVTVVTPSGTATLPLFTYYQPPTITSFTPTLGGGGTLISITGTNFTGTTSVRIGTFLATPFTVNSPTSITATANGNNTGLVDITVTTPGGTAIKPGFMYYGFPAISSFNPQNAAMGTTVTINAPAFGSFTGATSVSFGGIPASSFLVVNDKTITAVVGNGASGSVTVTTPGGTGALSGFTYNVVTSVGNVNNNSSELLVSPNPARNNIVVKHPAVLKTSHLKLIDIDGRTVKLLVIARSTTQTSFSVKGLGSGIYKLIWTDDKRMLTRTLLITQ